MPYQFTQRDVERFWKYVDRSGGPDACWPWMGSRQAKGYGRFCCWVNRKVLTVITHRFAWTLAHGDIPDGLHVLHHCDNPPCCNPTHFFLGTNTDNMQDAIRKGRKGKLNPDAVREIRRLAAEGWTQQAIADRFGVTNANVYSVLAGKTWGHVDGQGLAEGRRRKPRRLTDDDVVRIRVLAATVRNCDIAREYGVAPSLISLIKSGKAWPKVKH